MHREMAGIMGRKRTVSLMIDSDLYAEAKRLGLNVSRVSEGALANEVARLRVMTLEAKIAIDLEAANDYVTKHGSFADLARKHFST
jgi:antitoxin CcdA